MLSARESSGVKMLAGTSSGVKQFFKNYENKEVCLILPDQEPSPKSGVIAPFYGIDCLTPKSVYSMIRSNPEGVVLMIYILRTRKGYEVVFREVDKDIYSEDINVSAEAMNRSIQACISDDLSQYQWEYKRFKHNKEAFYKGL